MADSFWLTVGDSHVCPLCQSRAGQVRTLEQWQSLGLPPLHYNCRCDVIPLDEAEEAEETTIFLNDFLEEADFDELDPFDQAEALRDAARRILE